MSSRRSPSGPKSFVTGFVALAQTVLPPGSAAATAIAATGIFQQFVGPRGTAVTRVDPRQLSTNDVVNASPRFASSLGTSQISFSQGRVSSVGTASAVIEMTFTNPSTASATLVAQTWNLSVSLQGADL